MGSPSQDMDAIPLARSGWGIPQIGMGYPPPPAGQAMDSVCCGQYASCSFLKEDFLAEFCFQTFDTFVGTDPFLNSNSELMVH